MNNLSFLVGMTLFFVQSIESHVLWATKGENPESPLQMLGQGKMSTGASYGHLQFPIKLKMIEQSFDDLEDIVGSYERHAMYGGAAKALRHSMSRLNTKVSMIRGMVVPGALHLALEEDQVDLIEEALNRQQYLSREKRSLSTISQWMGLAGFGSSLYTAGQLNALKKDIDSVTSSHSTIAQTMKFQAVKINNLTRYIHDYHRVVLDAISQVSLGSKKAAMEIHGRSIQLTLETFTNEIRDLVIGLSTLTVGKLHPLLVEPTKLSASFRDLVEKAGLSGLAPLKEDPSFLFSCPTSALVSEEADELTVIVHVPLQTGNLDLYKFISAPILPKSRNSLNFALNINPEMQYLAIDSEHTKGGEYHLDQVSDCKSYNNIRHCPSVNFLTRNVSSLCLYNIMMMQLDNVKRNCPVLVKPLKQEIYSLGINRYILYSPVSTSISFDCTTDGKHVKPFVGQLFITMMKECPIAHTMGFTFSYTTSIYLQRDIVYLPTLYNLDKWFREEISSSDTGEKAVAQLTDLIQGELESSKDGIPLDILLERIQHRSTRLISWYLELLQHIIAVIALVYFIHKSYVTFKSKALPTLKPYLPTCIRRGLNRHNSMPVLQNLPLRRVLKPGEELEEVEEGLPPPLPKLAPL